MSQGTLPLAAGGEKIYTGGCMLDSPAHGRDHIPSGQDVLLSSTSAVQLLAPLCALRRALQVWHFCLCCHCWGAELQGQWDGQQRNGVPLERDG